MEPLEDYLGLIHGRPARAKGRVLAQNGIKTRHYALDKQQRTLYRNSEMAANAAALLRQLLAVISTGRAWDPIVATHGCRRPAKVPAAA